MDLDTILVSVAAVLSPLLTALLSYVAVKTAQWLASKTKNEYTKGVLFRLNDAVFTAVKDVQQKLGDAMRDASADGKLTSDEKARLKSLAILEAKAYIGKKGLKQLMTVLGLSTETVSALISNKIEAAVADVKYTRPI